MTASALYRVLRSCDVDPDLACKAAESVRNAWISKRKWEFNSHWHLTGVTRSLSGSMPAGAFMRYPKNWSGSSGGKNEELNYSKAHRFQIL